MFRQLNVWRKSLASTQECCKQYWTVLKATPHRTSAMRPPTSHHEKLSKLDEPDMRWRSKDELISDICGPHHMDEQRQDDQLEPIYNSSVPIQYIALKTSREQWTIETGGERGSERFILAARHDDDVLFYLWYTSVVWVYWNFSSVRGWVIVFFAFCIIMCTTPQGPIISKQEWIKCNKIVNVGYVVIEMKWSIT